MTVVQVVQEFSLKGGIECVAFELQQAWHELNLPTKVIAGIAPGSDGRSDIELLNAPFRQLATRGKFAKYFGRLLVVPAFTLVATQHVKRTCKNDIILSHGDLLYGDALIIHAVNKASLQAKQRAGHYGWMLNPMHWWVGARDRYMIGGLRYKKYIAISKRMAEEIHTLYGVPHDRIVIIPNGVNIARFNPEGPGRDTIRRELQIPDTAPVMLFVGHEFDRKGLAFIIDAMAELTKDVFLIVVGNDNPELYKKLAEKTGAADRVIFTGPRQDIPEINRAADIFVFPTAYEAFGLVTMEALASGCPILATRAGGIEDYLEDGVNGYFIERNGTSIATAIRKAFADDSITAMKLAARQTALAYSWHNIATQYYTALIELK